MRNAATSLTSRRMFLKQAGALGVACALPLRRASAQEDAPAAEVVRLGEGRHTYEWVSDWGRLPDGAHYGNTHGCIVIDSSDRVYVNTDTARAVLVFDLDGKYLTSFGEELAGGLHGMCVVEEEDGEFLYLAHTGRQQVLKATLEGKILWTRGVPEESGVYEDPGRYRPTSVAVLPGVGFFVGDGYGLSYVHQYDAAGEYVRTFGGRGTEPGKMQTPHGVWIDTRGETPVLIVADRENHRLQIFDLEGKLLDVVDQNLRRPCHVHQHGNDLVVADLAGRITILDGRNELVTHLGDNPDPAKRAQNGVPPEQWKDGEFISPHCARFDRHGNLYVLDWVSSGRVSKLLRVTS